jgi:hypothetical protein
VYIDAINYISSYPSSRLQLKLNEMIPSVADDYLIVSREKVNEFKKWIDK